jgi:hypothetical protein
MLFALAALASAADAPRPAYAGVGASLVGEAVADATIGALYKDTSLSGEVEASLSLRYHLEAGMTAGYRRIGGSVAADDGTPGGASWIWYAPVSLTLGATYPVGPVTLVASAGPSWVFFSEKPNGAASEATAGAKPGVLVQGGARIDLPSPPPSLHDPSRSPLGLQLAATVGYRWSAMRTEGCADGAEAPCGLALSALRLGVGVRVRY